MCGSWNEVELFWVETEEMFGRTCYFFIFEEITRKWAEDGLFNSPEYLLPRGLLFEWYKGFEWITAKGV